MNSESLYAHYSMIDEYDIIRFPNLSLTNPIHFKLKSGQSLYIPKNWWHWVRTTRKTFAVNYWFNNKVKHDPFVFNHTINCDIEALNDDVVYVWDSEKGNYSHQSNFKKFYNSGLDGKCVITLNDYAIGEKNSHVKKKISKGVNFPDNQNLKYEHIYNYNVWISSNKHDTGLHYDDEDGVLTVVEGEKDIILFPPSDTKYLYPYKVSYKWKESPAINCRYNASQKICDIYGISSAELLYVTCNSDKRVLSNISKLCLKYNNDLIWGFKKNGDQYRWEFYHYTLEQKVKITSWDIHKNEYHISDVEHYYFKEDDQTPIGMPFWGYGKYMIDNVLYDESKIFVIDDYISFRDNYNQYMYKLGFNLIKEKFRSIILEKYKAYQICIHNKKLNEIFVQYLGITNEEFLEFLETNDYPTHIKTFVQDQINLNNYKINNEITIVYDIKTQKIIRSGFYGNL